MSNDSLSDPTPILTTIGDLNSPLWGDERDRNIHLDGIAVAYEVQTIIGLTISAIMPWILGKSGVGWGVAVLSATAAGNLCYIRYISARGVKVHWAFEAGARTRGAIRLAILGVGFVGFLRVVISDAPPLSFDGEISTILGTLTGFVVGLSVFAGIAFGFVRLFKRRRQADVPDDVFTEA